MDIQSRNLCSTLLRLFYFDKHTGEVFVILPSTEPVLSPVLTVITLQCGVAVGYTQRWVIFLHEFTTANMDNLLYSDNMEDVHALSLLGIKVHFAQHSMAFSELLFNVTTGDRFLVSCEAIPKENIDKPVRHEIISLTFYGELLKPLLMKINIFAIIRNSRKAQ